MLSRQTAALVVLLLFGLFRATTNVPIVGSVTDLDGDGYSDTLEQHVGTNLNLACGANANPADFNDDGSFTAFDLSAVAADIGRMVLPATARKDIAPEPTGDNAITAFDLSAVAGRIGQICTPVLWQPSPPITAAFFYPWFPEAWNQQGFDPFTNFNPTLGRYSSASEPVVDQHLTWARDAHLEAFISSWWGQGHHTDAHLKDIMSFAIDGNSPYPQMRFPVYYECEGNGPPSCPSGPDPSVATIKNDLVYIKNNFFNRLNYLTIGGKPVVFVYDSCSTEACGDEMASRWRTAVGQFESENNTDLYYVLKVYPNYRAHSDQPDSWHQYGPAVGYDEQLPNSVSVSPGFWKKGETPRLSRDPARFESDVQRMVASGAFWQLVTTWNEWGEGTSVEPAQEFGTTYLDILGRVLPNPLP